MGAQPVRQVLAELPCSVRQRNAALSSSFELNELGVRLLPAVAVDVLALASSVGREAVCLADPSTVALPLVDGPSPLAFLRVVPGPGGATYGVQQLPGD